MNEWMRAHEQMNAQMNASPHDELKLEPTNPQTNKQMNQSKTKKIAGD